MEEIINEMKAAKSWFEDLALREKYNKTFTAQLRSCSEEEKKNIDKLLLAVVKHGNFEFIGSIAKPILQNRDAIDWKNRSDLVHLIVDTIKESTNEQMDKQHFRKDYSSFLSEFIRTLKAKRIEKQHFDKLYEIVELAFKTTDPESAIHSAALGCITDLSWEEHLPNLAKATLLIADKVKSNPTESGNWLLKAAEKLLSESYSKLSNNFVIKPNEPAPSDVSGIRTVAELYSYVLPVITELFKYCATQDWTSDKVGEKNICYTVCECIMDGMLQKGQVDHAVLKPLMPAIVDVWTSGDECFELYARTIFYHVASKEPSLINDQLDTLLDFFFTGNFSVFGHCLKKVYEYAPEKFDERLNELMTEITGNNDFARYMLEIVTDIAKRKGNVFKPSDFESLVKLYENEVLSFYVNSFLETVATNKLDDVLQFETEILNTIKKYPTRLFLSATLVNKLANNATRAQAYLDIIAHELTTSISDSYKSIYLNILKTIGTSYPDLLQTHKALLESLKNVPALRDYCQATLDVIEGRSLQAVSSEVAEQKQNLTNLDAQLASAQATVTNLSNDVKAAEASIGQVQDSVQQQQTQLAQLTDTVDATVAKVEVIDKKTLSHAPAWSVQVSKLLNTKAKADAHAAAAAAVNADANANGNENANGIGNANSSSSANDNENDNANANAEYDWKSLATRLGYSNDDIRNWATQPDPCLSLLDDWFATHKTREATHAVYNVLLDLNRTDAAAVVHEALESAQGVVLDDDDAGDGDKASAEAQAVFLSYQWAHQQHVKLLRQHLSLAGYAAWMDIGQMGGGDKLFAKIDAALRAAKVVVCCVTDKYAQSTNCNREVALAVTLGKPVIPLLLEDIKWPPSGAMGPIFSEYLYIQFFKRLQDSQSTSTSKTKAKANHTSTGTDVDTETSNSTGTDTDAGTDAGSTSTGSATAAETYWPQSKFSELLMQLRYTHSPDPKLIPPDSPYKSWWQPPDEIVVVKSAPAAPASASKRLSARSQSRLQSSANAKSPTAVKAVAKSAKDTAKDSAADESAAAKASSSSLACDVFISYQWDVQPHVKLLYRRLTDLGYTCWLDIMQMGGGDSLYDKIDRGLRSCRVVLSCVTAKYALSANCRREVSLSDALKKPIIPLLLEAMQWPPEGPMSMVFTQLLYIDFTNDIESLTLSKSSQFDELVTKVELCKATNAANNRLNSGGQKQTVSVAKSSGLNSRASSGGQKLPSIMATSKKAQGTYSLKTKKSKK